MFLMWEIFIFQTCYFVQNPLLGDDKWSFKRSTPHTVDNQPESPWIGAWAFKAALVLTEAWDLPSFWSAGFRNNAGKIKFRVTSQNPVVSCDSKSSFPTWDLQEPLASSLCLQSLMCTGVTWILVKNRLCFENLGVKPEILHKYLSYRVFSQV